MAFLQIEVCGSKTTSFVLTKTARTKLTVLGTFAVLFLVLTFTAPAGNSYAQATQPSCPGAVSELTTASRPDLALKFIDEIRAGGAPVAGVCEPERLTALSAVAAAKSGADEACAAAATLIASNNPAAALDLIGLIRGASEATEDALSIFSSCEKERRQALAALSSQPMAAQGTCDVVTSLTNSGRFTSALALVESIRGPADGRTVQESSLCEIQRLAALKGQADAEGGSNPAEKLGQNWEVLLRDWVNPLQGAGSLILGLILGFLVLARLLAFMPLMPIRSLPWKYASSSLRRAAFISGTALILLASGVTAFRLAEKPFDLSRLSAAWPGLIVGVLGSVLFAIFIASRLRLNLQVRTGDGKRSDWAEARIVASLTEMGSTPSRGIEVPRGVDLTALDDAGVTVPLTNKFLNALQSGVKALAGVTPWYVAVEVKSDDFLAFSITRNGWAVTSGIVSRQQLGLVTVSGADQSPDLFKMVSAAIVATLAPHYEGFEGLCGATDWRSIGLHCLATADYSSSPAQAVTLLGQAAELDPNNIAAQVAQQYYLHREAKRDDELKLYADWLDRNARRLEERDSSGYEGLILRMKMSYLACVMNLKALPPIHVGQAARDEMAEQAKATAKSLMEMLANPKHERNLLALEMMPAAALVYFDLAYPRIAYCDLRTTEFGFQHYEYAVLAATAPHTAYNAACSLAARDFVGQRKKESRRSRRKRAMDWDTQRVSLIRERLTCALTEPHLRDWARQDPEFECLRLHPDLKDLLSPSQKESVAAGSSV